MISRWKQADNLVWEELGGDALVINPESGARWSLNASAAAIWKLCDGSAGVEELAEALAKTGAKGLRFARREIAAFCEALAQAGLLHAAPGLRLAAVPCGIAVCRSGPINAPAFRALGLASGPRRRPSPRGNSGPG